MKRPIFLPWALLALPCCGGQAVIDLELELENHAHAAVIDYGWNAESSVTAGFWLALPVREQRLAEAGPCVLTRFDYALQTGGHEGTRVSAGLVTFALPEQTIEVAPNEVGGYDWPALDASAIRPGDEVTISVEGSADVPAFGALLVVPPALDVSLPPPASDGRLHLRAGEPLSISWDPPAEPVVIRVEVKRAVEEVELMVACELPADSGRVDVPAILLDQLPRGDSTSLAILRRQGWSDTLDHWRLELSAGGYLRLPAEDRPASFTDAVLE